MYIGLTVDSVNASTKKFKTLLGMEVIAKINKQLCKMNLEVF